MEIGGIAQGLLVTSYDGRPIKIEGNPSHPLNRGAADALAQASVLELYDPDRSRGVLRRGDDGELVEASWEEFAKWAKEHIKGDGGDIAVLSEASSSPSLAAMCIKLRKKFPQFGWYEYEAVSDDNVREGTFAAFVQHVLPVLQLEKANVIVSLDADLFGGGSPMAIKHARDFAAGRRLHDKKKPSQMNRLYVIESLHTITGASADHRMACSASHIGAVATELAAALGVAGVEAPKESKLPLLSSIKNDLEDNMGHAVVVAGPRQPAEVHALVAVINHRLGNVGKTVVYCSDLWPSRGTYAAQIEALVGRMRSGEVKTLLILGGNPAYNAPANLEFAEALKNRP